MAPDGEEGMCKDESIKVASVEANDFPKKKANRSSLDMLQTLQWIGSAMIMEGGKKFFGPIEKDPPPKTFCGAPLCATPQGHRG